MLRLHLGTFLVLLIGFCTVSGQSTPSAPSATSAPPPTNGSDFLYNATSTLLNLERKLPMTITINSVEFKKDENIAVLGKPLASVNFPAAKMVTDYETK